MSIKLSLNGDWKVTHIPYGSALNSILAENYITEGWITAKIPEELHITLQRAGLIRGHFYGKDSGEDSWIENEDWVYYKEFYWRNDNVGSPVLEFKGLDTFCDIYLNGKLIGTGNNMFTPIHLKVGEELRDDTRNVLIIRFRSAVLQAAKADYSKLFSHMTKDRIPVRKAQMNYKWDFCERLVSVGIWKDVDLVSCIGPQIKDYYVFTEEIEKNKAIISLSYELADVENQAEEHHDSVVRMLAVIYDKNGEKVAHECLDAKVSDGFCMEITEPHLWWPRPYGEQYLYTLRIELTDDDVVIDSREQKLGLRIVRLIEEPVKDGISFSFEVNGRRIFVRGANWVAASEVYTDVTDKDYEMFVHQAVQGNLSMLRIWGGGIYESETLFRLCDSAGIMIWNDFMFACGVYPQNKSFLDNVSNEAECMIRRYRNYTSLVIWAGSNEDDQAYQWAGRDTEFPNDQISRRVLPDQCRKYDPARAYIPSTPYSPDHEHFGGEDPNSQLQGDMHAYIFSAKPADSYNELRDNRFYKNITDYKPRFMTEFGFISLPEKESFHQYNFHNRKLFNLELIRRCVPFYDEISDDEEAVVYYSQLYQAMALKYWIEYFRSLKWDCAGSLYWKFNDPLADNESLEGLFPSMMSSIDMYHRPRMSFYYSRRAYEDVIIILREHGKTLDVCSVSELDHGIEGTLTVTRQDFSGNRKFSNTRAVVIEANAVTVLASFCRNELGPESTKDQLEQYILLSFSFKDASVENRYFFADLDRSNKIHYPWQQIHVNSAKHSGVRISLKLYAECFARNMRVNIADTPADYSDNYFDMDPDRTKTIYINVWDEKGLEDKAVYIQAEGLKRIVIPIAEMEAYD